MSAKEIIEQINALPDDELQKVFTGLAENETWREDLLDILLIASRQHEPAEPIDSVFRDLGIQDAGPSQRSVSDEFSILGNDTETSDVSHAHEAQSAVVRDGQ